MLFSTLILALSLAAGSANASVLNAPIEDTLIIPRQQKPGQGQKGQAQPPPAQPQQAQPQQGSGTTHIVVVGSLQNPNQVTFTPNTITAAKGDMVQYQFVSANHTATQSAGPQSACKPANNAVNSGFMPVQQGAQMVKTFTMVVQDDQPMYMYCAAANHCQQGMVMTINAAAADTKAFKSAAKKVKNNVAANNVNGGTPGRIATKQVGKAAAN